MTARREASKPPQITGFRFVRVLGLGGFADVFLYEQEMPRRPVAVKVLLAGALDKDLRTRFQTEANVMAQLSHHPSIVTIFHADIARDGRPYLVMEYCSGPGLAERYRRERMTVAESLRIGVRLGSAVETAHRAGILHRDIKPANVLTTDFGWPALTDFGIAATPGGGSGAAIGMSIPWSPPELLAAHPTGDERSDVYSLAATVYSLLAGRTPFELPGGRNGAADLVGRIERGHLPTISRGDLPTGLQSLLARAMDRDPDRRHASAAAFARALQQVEAELGLAVTPLDLNDDLRSSTPAPGSDRDASAWGGSSWDDGSESEQGTRMRPVLDVDPSGPGRGAHAAESPRPSSTTRSVPTPRVEPALRPLPAVGASTPRTPGAPDVLPTQGRFHSLPGVAPVANPAHVGTPEQQDRVMSPEVPAHIVEDAPRAPEEQASVHGARRVIALVAALVVIGAAVVVTVLTVRAPDDAPGGGTDLELVGPTGGGNVTVVPAPSDLVGTRQADGSVVFTWRNPAPADGDRYLWGVRSATGSPTLELVDASTVEVPAGSTSPVCIEVSIVRADRSASARPAEACAP